jgi:predicted SAM-dependent methyltransferase
MVKLNLSYHPVVLKGYTNVGMGSLDDLREKYPNRTFDDQLSIKQWDVFNLPMESESVGFIRAVKIFEYLTKEQEKLLFYEIRRVLKTGGHFEISVPDFDEVNDIWSDSASDWQKFVKSEEDLMKTEEWYGVSEYPYKKKWGYLLACVIGNINRGDHYHKNLYTTEKLLSIFKKLDFDVTHERIIVGTRDERSQVITMSAAKI